MARAAAFRRGLLRWFRRHGRDLPWRQTRDPYRIVVSEFMLQQTQVSRVEGYFHRFLEQYPTVAALATASPLAVRESWEGLGYYRRAANLHRLAQAVMEQHGGVVPSDPMVLRGLPGVGRYTAGAVASFAYERPTPAVDTNVARVLRRVFVDNGARRERTMDKQLWEISRTVLPHRHVFDFNQALMDFGATLCTARKPQCLICPMTARCRAYPFNPEHDR